MAGLLVRRFLEKTAKSNIHTHKAFENAFYLPKIDRPKHHSLRNTNFYCIPTHSLNSGIVLLNENIDDITDDEIIANIQEIIKNKEYVVAKPHN